MEPPVVSVVDPSSLRGLHVDFNVLPYVDHGFPGEDWEFCWTVNRLATAGWTSATVSLELVSDTGELRPLWRRTQRFPLPAVGGLHPPPGAWPPYGAIVETPRFDVEGRTLLYTGFGLRQLRVTLTPAGAAGGYPVDIYRSIDPEFHAAEWATLVLPTIADWNSSVAIELDIATDAWAAMSVDFEVTEQDETGGAPTTYPGSIAHTPAHPGARLPLPPSEMWSASSVVHNWSWLVKPMYHADDALRLRQFRYSVTLTWTDEFGNTYPDVRLPSQELVVRVSDQKWGAAAAAELWFWFWIAVGAALAIAALSFGIASAAVSATTALGAAALAAKLATISGIAGLLGSAAGIAAPFQIGFWQQQADDPPELDWNFWEITELPAEAAEALTHAKAALEAHNVSDGVAEEVAQTTQIACLGMVASLAYGRWLGARAAGSTPGAKIQADALRQARDRLVDVAKLLGKRESLFPTPPTAEDLAKNVNAALDQIAAMGDLDKISSEIRTQAAELRPKLLAECERGAAVLADPDYRRLITDTVVTESLREVDGWLVGVEQFEAETSAAVLIDGQT